MYVGNNPVNYIDPTGHLAEPNVADIYRGLKVMPPYNPGDPASVTLWSQIVRFLPRGLRIGAIAILLNMLFPDSVANPEGRPISDSERGWALLKASEGRGHGVSEHGSTVTDAMLQNQITADGKGRATRYNDPVVMGNLVWRSIDLNSKAIDDWVKDSSNNGNFRIDMYVGSNIGFGYDSGPTGPENITASLEWATTFLRKDGNGGWYIVTSYPSEGPGK